MRYSLLFISCQKEFLLFFIMYIQGISKSLFSFNASKFTISKNITNLVLSKCIYSNPQGKLMKIHNDVKQTKMDYHMQKLYHKDTFYSIQFQNKYYGLSLIHKFILRKELIWLNFWKSICRKVSFFWRGVPKIEPTAKEIHQKLWYHWIPNRSIN